MLNITQVAVLKAIVVVTGNITIIKLAGFEDFTQFLNLHSATQYYRSWGYFLVVTKTLFEINLK